MNKILLSALLIISCAACGHHTSTTASSDTKTTGDTIAGKLLPAGDFYKRYSGTVAGKPVVAQLTRYGNIFSGNYQYPGVSRIIDLIADSAKDNFIRFTESAPGPQNDSTGTDAHWEVSITADGIIGKWTSARGSTSGDIRLREDYPEGSSRLDAIIKQDSTALIEGKQEPHATASITAVFAQGNYASSIFINEKLRAALSLPPRGDVATAMAASLKKYFDDYRKENAPLLKDEHDTSLYWTYNFSEDEGLNVLYNDKGLLIIQDFMSDYTGGAHGNYGSTYLNLDVQNSKVWELRDVIADTAALAPLLNLAARNYFRVPKGASIEDIMLVSDVPVTDNFYLTPEGLTFIYNPYEIASYADGAVQLYIPYKKLMSLLTPAFKARMHLSAASGTALRGYNKGLLKRVG